MVKLYCYILCILYTPGNWECRGIEKIGDLSFWLNLVRKDQGNGPLRESLINPGSNLYTFTVLYSVCKNDKIKMGKIIIQARQYRNILYCLGATFRCHTAIYEHFPNEKYKD